jgi:type II secretory pathway pseudopilin PulG
VELMITMTMMVVVAVIFLTVFESLNRGVASQTERSQANDQARQAIEHLDREIRSGNVVYDPADEALAFFSFRIYSQANATTRLGSSPYADSGGATCVQWMINDDRELIRRVWLPNDPTVASDWRVFATDIVNRVSGIDQPAFSVPDPDAPGTVEVTLMVDADTEEVVSRPVRIETSLTGRNTTLGLPTTACDPPPEAGDEGEDDDDDEED